jgi:hypothetical protein
MAGGARAWVRCTLACWNCRFAPPDDRFSVRDQRSMWPSSWLVIGTVRWICERSGSDRSTPTLNPYPYPESTPTLP